ncbi:hypothetical protein SDRG_10383 [Saprolegnia diclina VS20]|uniref:BZIP domain-containing protein n=1 Tax=Saprolegnia diclina (strain VS20) TaxID=1156394 RepID=T0QF13_SAPDV|nr:hypothetical protein SDRG_10383 [Saprolegnia diclina VS20]EQC32190.1 hypothetical protein SDRG_10383 [Saprolegnia diclina VS20]|eukprot:XP_008614592.1 hypothetical protein SDRG_10383 [Saprolegnia diclina VS20]
MSTIKTHPPTLQAAKKQADLIRVKEEFVLPKVTLAAMPSPAKLKIPAPVVRKDKRKAMVQSPLGSDCSSSSSTSSKKRKNTNDGLFDNDMGSAEEKIKEMERQLLSLDPDSKEAKKKRRLIRNRMSAQLHRERKKAYVVQLEEQLQAKDDEMSKMKAQLEALLAENKRLKHDDVIKVEKVDTVVAAAVPKAAAVAAFAEPIAPVQADIISDAESFIYEMDSEPEHWDSSILNDLDISSEDLMFAEPAVAPAPARPTKTVEHDSFAAKKNVAMMMAIVFSMTFFGGMMSIFDSFTTGSATNGFCSYFKSYTPKLLSEMSVKSRVLSDLDGTTWMDFPELDEPAQKSDKSSNEQQYAGGIPFDDLLDTDFSLTFAMPLGDDDEEEDDDMGLSPSSESGDHTSEEEESDDSEAAFTMVAKNKDVSYANLTRLWCEKRHVLCTLATQGDATLRRAVVDMSHVNDTVSMESSFADVLASFTMGDDDPKVIGSSEKQVLSFLYPMGVFSKEMTDASAVLDPMPFMEVACHI